MAEAIQDQDLDQVMVAIQDQDQDLVTHHMAAIQDQDLVMVAIHVHDRDHVEYGSVVDTGVLADSVGDHAVMVEEAQDRITPVTDALAAVKSFLTTIFY